MRSLRHRIVAVSLAALAWPACRQPPAQPGPSPAPPAASPRTVQPGAPGTPSRVVPSASAAAPKAAPADIRFMQGMIGHHAQALDMVALLKTRTSSQTMRMLGLRIEVSQKDEIALMQTWLRDHGAEVPAEHAHHLPGAPLMPGMLTPAEMTRLGAATGVEFDRLFLELMIKHHEGALVMVKDLMAGGGGNESGVFAFAADVEADQSAEIGRMRAMRAAMGK